MLWWSCEILLSSPAAYATLVTTLFTLLFIFGSKKKKKHKAFTKETTFSLCLKKFLPPNFRVGDTK